MLKMVEDRCYSPEEIDSIIRETNVKPDLPPESKSDLAARLEECARAFLVERLWQQSPSPSDVESCLKKIEDTAKKLLDAIANKPDTPRPKLEARRRLQLIAGDANRLESVVAGVRALQEWAEDARSRERVKMHPQRRKGQASRHANDFVHIGEEDQHPRHSGDVAFNCFLAGLIKVYKEIFQRQAGTSVSPEGRIGGPLIRFIDACLRGLRKSLTEDDLKADAQLQSDLYLTPAALRARIRTIVRNHADMAESAQQES